MKKKFNNKIIVKDISKAKRFFKIYENENKKIKIYLAIYHPDIPWYDNFLINTGIFRLQEEEKNDLPSM